MNTKQIIAELRRSADEDASPWDDLEIHAFEELFDWKFSIPRQEFFQDLLDDDLRTFYLFVAEAMESTG